MSLNVDKIEEDAKRRRRECNYEYLFDWPEIDAIGVNRASSVIELLKRASSLVSIASRKSDEQEDYTNTKLIRDFLIRGTKALRSTLCLVHIGNHEDAWATTRVIIERCIFLAYLSDKGMAKEFAEHQWHEMKKWAYRSVSLGQLPKDLVDEYDAHLEEALGHRLGRQERIWSDPNIEEMCKEAFGSEQGVRIYSLYRMASANVHPGRDGGDEYLAESMMANGVGDPREVPLQSALDALEALMDIAEPRLIDDRS